MKKQIAFKEYSLSYYYKLGTEFSDEEVESVKDKLFKLNVSSGCNFSYGIFDPNNDFKKCCENLMICIIEKGEETVGFFYNYIMEDKKIVHQGLVVIARNFGENLLYVPYMISNKMIHKNIGDFFITNISSTPKIIGEISMAFDHVWPMPNANLIKPHPEYKEVARCVYENYVKHYFPMPESISFDEKRFIICSNAKEMGFETNFRKLARHQDLNVNLFCMFWIDYTKNEDMIQVGKYTKETLDKNDPVISKFI